MEGAKVVTDGKKALAGGAVDAGGWTGKFRRSIPVKMSCAFMSQFHQSVQRLLQQMQCLIPTLPLTVALTVKAGIIRQEIGSYELDRIDYQYKRSKLRHLIRNR